MERELTDAELLLLAELHDSFTDLMGLAESAPLEMTRRAAGKKAARILAKIEAILGPDDNEQLAAQAEEMLVNAANSVGA